VTKSRKNSFFGVIITSTNKKTKPERMNIMSVKVLNKDNFEESVLKNENPVVVDFWAPWCGPCRMLSPVVDQVAEETEGVSFGKVNVDEEKELASRYGIMSIPALVLFRDGKAVDSMVGFRPKERVVEFSKG
jgi:thioredoxin 1